MTVHRRTKAAQTRWGALLGLVTLALVSALPAAAAPAPNNCNQPNWSIGVQFLAIQSGQNLTLVAQPDGSFAGQVLVRIYCTDERGLDIGEVTNAVVAIWTSVPNTTINGQPANDSSNPVQVAAPDGFATITINSTDPGLADGQYLARVGQDAITVTQAFGQPVSSDTSPAVIGNVWARTPELSSLALFGAGATGMVGYALMRLRTMRRRAP